MNRFLAELCFAVILNLTVRVFFALQEAWYAFHTDKPYVSKFMKALLVGRVKENDELGNSSGTVSPHHSITGHIEGLDVISGPIEKKK